MSKKILKLGIAGIIGMSIAMSAPINASADYPTMSRNVTPMNQIVLEPGWRSSCDANFVLENLGNNPAEVKITLGKDGQLNDTIHRWDKRGYDLISSLSFAKQLGKTVDIDDVAMIENRSKDSRVSVHC